MPGAGLGLLACASVYLMASPRAHPLSFISFSNFFFTPMCNTASPSSLTPPNEDGRLIVGFGSLCVCVCAGGTREGGKHMRGDEVSVRVMGSERELAVLEFDPVVGT